MRGMSPNWQSIPTAMPQGVVMSACNVMDAMASFEDEKAELMGGVAL